MYHRENSEVFNSGFWESAKWKTPSGKTDSLRFPSRPRALTVTHVANSQNPKILFEALLPSDDYSRDSVQLDFSVVSAFSLCHRKWITCVFSSDHQLLPHSLGWFYLDLSPAERSGKNLLLFMFYGNNRQN